MAESKQCKRKRNVSEQNVLVVVRARLINTQELDEDRRLVVKYLPQNIVLVNGKKFKFDLVFKPKTTQVEIYEHVVAPMIIDTFSGYNCTVITFGESGSGKTYTMTGNNCTSPDHWKKDDDAGIIPRAASHIFELLPSNKIDDFVKVSYLEVYNEEIHDLLSDSDTLLNINNNKDSSVSVQGLREIRIHDSKEICKLIQKGNTKRQAAPSLINGQNSQSHTIFTISIFTKENIASNENIWKSGKITFVDLSGSENISQFDPKNTKTKEATSGNKSILTLGKVINVLADKTKKYVPYRESKLTRLLQDSLGGGNKTCFIATISPVSDETFNTLEYANRAKEIKNTPTINGRLDSTETIDSLLDTIKYLQVELQASRNSEGFYIHSDSYAAMLKELKDLQIKKKTYGDVLKDMKRQAEELQYLIKSKEEEKENITVLCQKSREKINKHKLEIKEKIGSFQKECFISQIYENNAHQMAKAAEDLLKMSEMLSTQCNILQEKLEKNYHINQMNESVAQKSVAKIRDELDKFSKENVNSASDDNLYELYQDINKFKLALWSSLVKVKDVFDNFEKNYNLNVPTKENIFGIMKEFMHFIQHNVLEIKLKLDLLPRHQNFEHNCLLEFVDSMKNVTVNFEKAVYEVIQENNDLFEKEEIDLYKELEDLERDLEASQKEDEIFKKQLAERDEKFSTGFNSIKDLIMKRHETKDDKLHLRELVNETKKEMDKTLKNYTGLYKILNINDNLDAVSTEIESLKKNVQSEAQEFQELKLTHWTEPLTSLQSSVTSQFEEATTSINSNYNSLDCRIGYLINDIEQDKIYIQNFVEKSRALLSNEFLKEKTHQIGTPRHVSEFDFDIRLQKAKDLSNFLSYEEDTEPQNEIH